MTTTKIELLRHGLPEGDDCFRGHTDFLLTNTGMDQMNASVANSVVPDLVLSSPLLRCRDFAEQYAQKYKLPVIIKQEFKEIDFGDWDGHKKQAVWDNEQEQLTKFWADPWNMTPPNGESLKDYDKRIVLAWQNMLQEYKGKRLLLVTHGGVIKQIMRILLEMPRTNTYLQRMNIPYAAKVEISVYHDENGQLWPEIHWPVS
ncbi:histidine phosphatase family protein [Vibrio algarum]|uniref:phosphoglycerate mutase (2,3-diphosphoglycerate-dependent) n=1 Tax=Vibrio algarum TaxID=3020714 RepID=A0ABT4YU61_9VIBR|nr:histidine phosphatase family protein [Vibrio sp. KJ40-1]MDB1125123.1 histidine phosphatase family protein [Vibrio sp. KJ40-1]